MQPEFAGLLVPDERVREAAKGLLGRLLVRQHQVLLERLGEANAGCDAAKLLRERACEVPEPRRAGEQARYPLAVRRDVLLKGRRDQNLGVGKLNRSVTAVAARVFQNDSGHKQTGQKQRPAHGMSAHILLFAESINVIGRMTAGESRWTPLKGDPHAGEQIHGEQSFALEAGSHPVQGREGLLAFAVRKREISTSISRPRVRPSI